MGTERLETSPNKTEASMEEIVHFLLPPRSKLEQQTVVEQKHTHNAQEEKFMVVRPIREVDKLNAYKTKNLAATGKTEIPPTIRQESHEEDYNCIEYKVWMFNHIQCRSFWDDVKEAGLFD